MKMTREQRQEYQRLIREGREALKALNDAVSTYNREARTAFGMVEQCEGDYEAILNECEGFAAEMEDQEGAEPAWRAFTTIAADYRDEPKSLPAEDTAPMEVFATLESQ
jgi:hypothetical protein